MNEENYNYTIINEQLIKLMALEAERHYCDFLSLQNFIENSDERILSKVKIGQLYQRMILTLKKGIQRYQEIEQVLQRFGTLYTQINSSIISDLLNAELQAKQDDYFTASNFLFSASQKQQQLQLPSQCSTYKLIKDKYDYSRYMVKAYIGDDTDILQTIQQENEEKSKKIQEQIQLIQNEQNQENKQEQIGENNDDENKIQDIITNLYSVKIFNEQFGQNKQNLQFSLPLSLYSEEKLNIDDLQLYGQAQKAFKQVKINQIQDQNSQKFQELKTLISEYKTNLYWYSHIFRQIKKVQFPQSSIEFLLKKEFQLEVITFTTINVKIQNLKFKLTERQQFLVFCWFLYQLEQILNDPLKAQIRIENEEYKTKLQLFTIVTQNEKGQVVQQQIKDQAMIYQYKKEICGIFYSRMQQFITQPIKGVEINKMLEYANSAIKTQEQYEEKDIKVIIPPTMPKPIFFDTVMDEIQFEDCFE